MPARIREPAGRHELRETALSDYILETEGLTKDFDGFVAVRDVALRVRRGAIHALIGPNGAGKTTVFNLLTKFLTPSAGRIVYDGVDITGLRPATVARRGLVRSFQISAIFPYMTARENIHVALQRADGSSRRLVRGRAAAAALERRTARCLDEVGLGDAADTLAAELPYGRKRALELATTLALEPALLLLDEPTSGLGREDIARVAALIKTIGRSRTIVMVEHNLSVVADLCDTITVLTRGEVLVEGPYAAVSRDARVIEAYMGSDHG